MARKSIFRKYAILIIQNAGLRGVFLPKMEKSAENEQLFENIFFINQTVTLRSIPEANDTIYTPVFGIIVEGMRGGE